MSSPAIVHDTFVIERQYAATPQRLFSALADPETKRAWYAGTTDYAQEHFEMSFVIGGYERSASAMGDDTPYPGLILSSEGRFEDIVPDRRVVTVSTMAIGGRRISSALVTYEISPHGSEGSALTMTHQAVFYEGSDGPKMRKGGWELLLDRLGGSLAGAGPAAGAGAGKIAD